MDKRVDGWVDGWMGEGGVVDGGVGGWGRVDGWTDGWMPIPC